MNLFLYLNLKPHTHTHKKPQGRRRECRASEENKSIRERYDPSAGRVDRESGEVGESE